MSIDRLSLVFFIPSSIVTIILIVLIISDVIARNVFVVALTDTVTIGSTGLLIIVFWGAATTSKENKHIIMGVVQEHCSRKVRLLLQVLSTILSFFVLAVLSWFAWKISLRSYSLDWRLVCPLALPIGMLQGAIASGFTLLALQQISNLIKLIAPEKEGQNS